MPARRKTTTGCVIAAAVVVALFFANRGKVHSQPTPLAATSTSLPSRQALAPKHGSPSTPPSEAIPKNPKLEVCGVADLPADVGDTVTVGQYLFDTNRPAYDAWKMVLQVGELAALRELRDKQPLH